MQGQDEFCIKNLHTSFRLFNGAVFNSLHSGSIFYAKTLTTSRSKPFSKCFLFSFFSGLFSSVF